MWLLFAFSGPVFWALSTHIDKYLVDRYFARSDTAVLVVFTALIGLCMLPLIWFYHGAALWLPFGSICVMVLSGVMYMGAMLFYLRAIQSEEASVVAPLFQASTVFTVILAYLLLGETLSWHAGAGVALIALGALLLSLDQSLRVKKFKLRLLLLMLTCTFVLALSSVLFKFFAIQEDFWSTTFWMAVGEGLFGVGILLVPRYWRQFTKLLKTNTGALLGVSGSNELINLGGSLGVRFASLFAPVAVISAISSTTTLFAFAFGALLTVFAPSVVREDISPKNLLKKGLASAVIVVGVVLANQ